jgi:hypothetical protein
MSLNTQLPNGVILAWPTPIYRKVWPGDEKYAASHRDIILEKEKITPSVHSLAVGILTSICWSGLMTKSGS